MTAINSRPGPRSFVPSPVWLDVPMPETPALTADSVCDVCIVGGGIAGLLIAERLVGEGMSVIVLDQGTFCHGETGHTTAHFVTALDDRYTELERMHGERGARLAGESHGAAIDYVENLVDRLGADCLWKRLDGFLVVNEKHRDEEDRLLDNELLAARRAGLDIERVRSLPMHWPSLGGALRFGRQAQVHPLRLLRSVARHLQMAGARLHGQTHVTDVRGGSGAHVETAGGPSVKCKHVVIATNTPINNRVAVHTKQAGYQTYVMAFKVPAGALPPLLLWDGLWEDDVAYRYIRLLEAPTSAEPSAGRTDLLIVGGEDHKTGQGPAEDQPYRRIEEWTRLHFPICGEEARRWSGEVMEPADGLGFIGRNPLDHRNVYIVTGDSGNGMTHAGIAAMLIPDLILDRPNPWATLYDPARKIGLHALRDYLKENANTAAQYRDWFKRGDVSDESQIPAGEGAIIARGLSHFAVYKDEAGRCTRLSARCPHLGGVVQWNSQEKTWDCPCHASRFDKHGKVMHGPANSNLKMETPEQPPPAPPAA
jgi:glycine/D-amino acid oxidase-like deaminating enzyme/nitrite reductase/ring-hydroxylating ferredoxin subunit